MKTLKFIGVAILLVVACGTFVACDGDDEEEENYEIMEKLLRKWYGAGVGCKYDAVVFSRDRTYWFGERYDNFSETGRWSANDKYIKLFDRYKRDGTNLPNESRKFRLQLKTETHEGVDKLWFEDTKGMIHQYEN